MKLFCSRHSVCKECGVHFEPLPTGERYSDLCAMHRKPLLERALRRDSVMAWAGSNWERLEKMMREEQEEQEERDKTHFEQMRAIYANAQNANNLSNFSGLGAHKQ